MATEDSNQASTDAPAKRRGRATAETMAAQQRSISVSEFFSKNRHLLGFDNPRKALLTTVKEAVDNSLDACEEAGILPELWVHIEPAGKDRFKVSVQDNGPGIVKKQIPLIFGKLLYGSKFHRLRMSRGQQGIGISAAGMYGQLTTGKPVRIVSKTAAKKPAHYFEIQIDTKTNNPEILNGKGEGIDIPIGSAGQKMMADQGIEWENIIPPAQIDGEKAKASEIESGTRVTIDLEGIHKRGKGSVDEYLEQTAIANPHVTIHYRDPDGNLIDYHRSSSTLPKEAKEIKPHPYGVELGRLVTMLKDSEHGTLAQFLTESFSRVSPPTAKSICSAAKLSTRAKTKRIGREEADTLYRAIQETKIQAPATDCLSPIGEDLLLKGLRQVVPGEFYAAATRPPAVYRGNPFVIEAALAYGGVATAQKVSYELLMQLLDESDSRTLKQFLVATFDGMGPDGAEKILRECGFGPRTNPSKLNSKERKTLFDAMRNVNTGETQSMQVLRYANRVPLQFKLRDCAVTQTIMSMNWRSYGLNQSRGSVPGGPVTIMVHMASVWVPFTSESKEAIASYPEIERELRLAIQAVGRKLGVYLKKRQSIRQEGERRSIFLRYLNEVATACEDLCGADRESVYERLMDVARKKTAVADVKLDDRGRKVEVEEDDEYGGNVLIVKPDEETLQKQLLERVSRASASSDSEASDADEE